MSHVISIPDELYRAIEDYAARRGASAEAVILEWAESLREQRHQAPVEESNSPVYNPADDPLAAFLGKGVLTSPDAISRHDDAIAQEGMDAHEE